jgi:hypothetical protein
VRAAEDENLQVSLWGVSIGTFSSYVIQPLFLQRIQRITRMSAFTLRESKEMYVEFSNLITENI